MPIVEHILKNTELKLEDMDAIAVAVGPRLLYRAPGIGVAAAKGLPLPRRSPPWGYPPCRRWRGTRPLPTGLIVCAMDARRNQVYNADFAAENGVLTPFDAGSSHLPWGSGGGAAE